MQAKGRLVAARYRDGHLVKGHTADFRPDRAVFHVLEDGRTDPTPIAIRELKALFFVKTLDGDPRHEERKEFVREESFGEKTWVEFFDGEKLAGWAGPLPAENDGFYLLPTDPDSNLEKAWIYEPALVNVVHGAEAEAASRKYAARKGIEKLAAERWEQFLAEA
ncbi:MAG: hypothetical protein KC591_08675 [Gemmatimonadetes bacterium]|nr:hypothetical protein [Gemmatimonadota bacterium]